MSRPLKTHADLPEEIQVQIEYDYETPGGMERKIVTAETGEVFVYHKTENQWKPVEYRYHISVSGCYGLKVNVTETEDLVSGNVEAPGMHREGDCEVLHAALSLIQAVFRNHAICGVDIAARDYKRGIRTTVEDLRRHLGNKGKDDAKQEVQTR